MTWRTLVLDAHTGLFTPCLVTWDPETGEFTRVEGPKGFDEIVLRGTEIEIHGALLGRPERVGAADGPQA